MIKEKTAIVMAGGAMRSAHGAGFLYALSKKLDIPAPNIMIGSSGDAGNTLYYAADQCEEMKKIWVELLSTPKFISLMRFWRVMDVDYLIDKVFKEQEPLNIGKVQASPIEWMIPLTDFKTGDSRYVSAADHIDPFEILRAAKAIPFFYGKKISINNNQYIDGELGPTLEDHVRYALAQGATRLVVVRHNSLWSRISKLYARIYGSTVNKGLRRSIIHDMTQDSVHITIPEAKILLLIPKNLPIRSPADHNQAHLRTTFERGIADALALEKELRTLLMP